MKRSTEGELGAALRDVDLRTYVFRPPDPKTGAGVSNWKPADYLVWIGFGDDVAMTADDRIAITPSPPSSAWFEVKDVDAVSAFPFAELRPSQLAGIRDAERMGIPYWLAVWWRRHREWTISDAIRVIQWFEAERVAGRGTSIPRELLVSRFGISSTKAQLGSTLKGVLLGEVD